MQGKESKPTQMKFDPYLHGTTSRTLALLAMTDFKLVHPINLLADYGLAPLNGELNGGGLHGWYINPNLSFGRLKQGWRDDKRYPCEYGLFQIINSYAERKRNYSGGQPTARKLSAVLIDPISDTYYGLVVAAIYIQIGEQPLCAGLEDKQDQKQFLQLLQQTRQLLFLVKLINQHIFPNMEMSGGYYSYTEVDSVIRKRIRKELHFDRLIERLFKLNVDIEAIYKNPTAEKLQLLIELLTLDDGTPIFTKDKDGPQKGSASKCVFDSKILIDFLKDKGRFSGLFELALYTTADDELWPSMSEKVNYYIRITEHRMRCLENIINGKVRHLDVTSRQQQLADENFPIILVYEGDDIAEQSKEYRATRDLVFGKDITMVATDTLPHAEQLLCYFSDLGLDNVEVVLFSALKEVVDNNKQPHRVNISAEDIEAMQAKKTQERLAALPQEVELKDMRRSYRTWKPDVPQEAPLSVSAMHRFAKTFLGWSQPNRAQPLRDKNQANKGANAKSKPGKPSF